ncbi:MAG: hypothetical protein VX610_07715 [SAR324 cluster bacterium]|nr:hypothetical protein [SAR324 cluster bacterium]
MTDLDKLSGAAARFLTKREHPPENDLDELFKLIRMLTKGEGLHLGQILVEALESPGTAGAPLAETLRGLPNEELLQRLQQFADKNRASRFNEADALLKNLSQASDE